MCERGEPQYLKFHMQCPVVRIFDQAEAAAVERLKSDMLWRGREWFEGLKSDYVRACRRLEMSGETVTGDWRVGEAWHGQAILDARASVDAEEMRNI